MLLFKYYACISLYVLQLHIISILFIGNNSNIARSIIWNHKPYIKPLIMIYPDAEQGINQNMSGFNRKDNQIAVKDKYNHEHRKYMRLLATHYHIYGFCYVYKYTKSRFMYNNIAESMLYDNEPSTPFYMYFQNIKGKQFNEEELLLHFHKILPYFQHKSYIYIDNEPLYSVEIEVAQGLDIDTAVNEQRLLWLDEFMWQWNKFSVSNGLTGIRFVISIKTLSKNVDADQTAIKYNTDNQWLSHVKNALHANEYNMSLYGITLEESYRAAGSSDKSSINMKSSVQTNAEMAFALSTDAPRKGNTFIVIKLTRIRRFPAASQSQGAPLSTYEMKYKEMNRQVTELFNSILYDYKWVHEQFELETQVSSGDRDHAKVHLFPHTLVVMDGWNRDRDADAISDGRPGWECTSVMEPNTVQGFDMLQIIRNNVNANTLSHKTIIHVGADSTNTHIRRYISDITTIFDQYIHVLCNRKYMQNGNTERTDGHAYVEMGSGLKILTKIPRPTREMTLLHIHSIYNYTLQYADEKFKSDSDHGPDTEADVWEVILDVLNDFASANIPIFVSVHDYQYLWPNNPHHSLPGEIIRTTSNRKRSSAKSKLKLRNMIDKVHIQRTKELFSLATKVIFSTKALKAYYMHALHRDANGEHSLSMHQEKFVSVPPMDRLVYSPIRVIPSIYAPIQVNSNANSNINVYGTNAIGVINIAFIGEFTKERGCEAYIQLSHTRLVGHYRIDFHVLDPEIESSLKTLDYNIPEAQLKEAQDQRIFLHYHKPYIPKNNLGSSSSTNALCYNEMQCFHQQLRDLNIHLIAYMKMDMARYDYSLANIINSNLVVLYIQNDGGNKASSSIPGSDSIPGSIDGISILEKLSKEPSKALNRVVKVKNMKKIDKIFQNLIKLIIEHRNTTVPHNTGQFCMFDTNGSISDQVQPSKWYITNYP